MKFKELLEIMDLCAVAEVILRKGDDPRKDLKITGTLGSIRDTISNEYEVELVIPGSAVWYDRDQCEKEEKSYSITLNATK